MITHEQLLSDLYYDPETGDFTWLNNHCGRYLKTAGEKVNSRKTTYLRFAYMGKMIRAHRLAWFYIHKEWPNIIRHIDGNGLNNSLINLMNVSSSDDYRNQRITNMDTSIIVGVLVYGDNWSAGIIDKSKWVNLGRYDDFFEACCARKSAEIEYGYHENHGEKRHA